MSDGQDEDQALRAMFARLPRAVEPEHDLWTGIHARLEKKRSAVTMPWAIAASLSSLAVGAMLALGIQRQQAPTPPIARVAAPAEVSFVPASTNAMRNKLRADCAAQLANLPPKTREKVERDLALIDASVRDIQTALSKDPGNALLQDLLVTTYQNELSTLANVQMAASESHSEVSI